MPLAAFFDLDGTLAVRNQPPSAADVAAIRAFRQRGNFAFLCTGRSPGYLYADILDIGFDGIVSGAGAHVTLGDRLLYRNAIPTELMAPIQRAFEASASTLIMETERTMVQLASASAHTLVPSYSRVYTADEWQARFGDEVTSKFTVYGAVPSDILPFVREHLSVIDHGRYIEIVPKGCSKADGIRRVLEELNIPRENSLGFGDSMNDYDMITYVGVGVAMGNADEPLKAIADRVTASYTENGVAQVLNEYV